MRFNFIRLNYLNLGQFVRQSYFDDISWKKAKKIIIVIYLDSISTKISISSIHILNKRWFYEISWTSHNRNWNSYLIGVLFIYYGNLYKLNFQLCLWITRVSQQICLRLIFIHELFLQNSIYLYLFNSILYAFNK